MTKIRVPVGSDLLGTLFPLAVEVVNQSNDHDTRIVAIEKAIARIDAALAHFQKEVK